MAYVITQNCCNDASCLAACPVGCIHPTPDEPDFATSEMLYVDPNTCIDCGACADWCPVDAIKPDTALTARQEPYRQANADYYRDRPLQVGWKYLPLTPLATVGRGSLRVAVVGAGPAAWYCAKDLLAQPHVEVSMFDRLPAPHGLARYGVAPDHPATKQVMDQFLLDREQTGRFGMFLNVEVGRDVTHDELLDHHHAVIYAYGASSDRRLDVPGEDLSGSVAASAFVGWYNGHPDLAELAPRLDTRRAVIVGNGNVALDVARVLTVGPALLARTDIADHALDALRSSAVEEVVILGRRSARDAAFTWPELLALTQLDDVDVVVDAPDLEECLEAVTDTAVRRKLALLASLPTAAHHREPGRKRIVLRFNAAPTQITGDKRVAGITVAATAIATGADGRREAVVDVDRPAESIETGLVIRSVGFRGTPIAGVPFDEIAATIPNEAGRVVDGDRPVFGTYTSGWIKRGPSGVIGSNRLCAKETVQAIIDDFVDGRLAAPENNALALVGLIAHRRPEVVDADGWAAIDTAERAAGRASSRPRRKFVYRDDFVSQVRKPMVRRRLLPLVGRRSH